MRIELLVFEGCPNWEAARERLRAGMASLGITGEVQEIPVESLEHARDLNFPGSPTLRVNGDDVAPLPEGYEPALGCRTYVVQGRRQGLPDGAWILEALRKAQAEEAHACCTPMAKPKATASCPACGTEGKPVKPVTLRALLQPHLQPLVRDEVYRFCASPNCTLVYYSAEGDQSFTRADLTVRVGVKERNAPRPLCYCFDHSAESIQEEWARTGKSTVLDSIKAEVKAGTCHCEITNPGGGCCLGDITKAVKTLMAAPDVSASGTAVAPMLALSTSERSLPMSNQTHDWCPPAGPKASAKPPETGALPPAKGEGGAPRTVWASIGLGVLASACCCVPLALAGLGVATGTLGAKIAWIRPWALGGLVVLLLGVLGWWARKRFASARPEADCCAVVPPFPSLVVTSLAVSFVVAWASPRILHPGRNTTLTALATPAPTGGTFLVISTPQFDCPPCVGTLPQTMAATPGVASVQMDFDKRETHIAFQPGAAVNATMARWKKELGFEGKEVRRESVPVPTSGDAGVK